MMIAKIFVLLFGFAWSGAVLLSAPLPCKGDSADHIPGKWKQIREKDVDLDQNKLIPKEELPKLRKQMELYAELMHQALGKFTGFEATWYSTTADPMFKNGPASYELSIPMYRYLCEEGVAKLEDEYADQLSLRINGISHSSANLPSIEGKKYLLFGSPVGLIRGFPAFEPFWENTPSGIVIQRVVLVHKPGKLPFRYATRKQVLESLKAVNEEKRTDALAKWDQYDRIRPEEEQKKDHDRELKLFLTGAKDDQQKQKWTERFERDYRTDEQKHTEQSQKYNAYHDRVREHFDTLMASQTPGQLRQTAFADGYGADESFEFRAPKSEVCPSTECGEHNGKPLAIQEISYFDETLPKSSPQFFAVTFTLAAKTVRRDGKYYVENPRMEKMREEFFARFDFNKLVSMIGK